jgi:hypothetical protein
MLSRPAPWTLLLLSSVLPLAAACGDDDSLPASDAGMDAGPGAGGNGGSSGGGAGKSGSGGKAGGTADTGGNGRAGAGGKNGNAAGKGSAGSAGKAGAGGHAAGSGNSAGSAAGSGNSAGSAAGSGNAGATAGSGAGSGGNSAVDDAGTDDDAGIVANPLFSFFVGSRSNGTGDLGGIDGADAQCQELAGAAGAGTKTWHAFLSGGTDQNPINARDRIGTGPWYNVNGVLLAPDLTALLARAGDADLFLTEQGAKVNGAWNGSPLPSEHDILTGSDASGNLLLGATCDGWTSNADVPAQVGHSDGLGDNGETGSPSSSWYSAELNYSCADTAPQGGAGQIYCFAID